MVNWDKDRKRQLKKRAQAEEAEEKIKQWSAGPARYVRPSIGKAALRAMGEELVRQHQDKLRSGAAKKTRGKRSGRRR